MQLLNCLHYKVLSIMDYLSHYFITAIICFFTFIKNSSAQGSGPYSIILDTVKNCNDKGTGEMSFNFTSREENGIKFHSGTIKLPYGIDDNLMAEGDASRYRAGEWKPIGLIWKLGFPKACSNMKFYTPDWFIIIDKSNAESSDCPIKKGTYQVLNYSVTGKMKGVDSLEYGRYRIRVSYKRKGKKIGCICYLAQVIQAK